MTSGRGPGLRRRLARLLLAAAACAVAAGGCGQWSSMPPREAVSAPIPLGPGAPVRVASDSRVDAIAAASWRRRVAVAWIRAGATGRVASVAVSRDAGAHFDPPREIAIGSAVGAGESGAAGTLRVSVTAPARQGASSGQDAHVWVRVGPEGGTSRTWRSTDEGRTFSVFDGAPPGGAFDGQWGSVLDGDGVHVVPPAALRAAGPRTVASPPGAVRDRPPAAVLDEHGALALAWLEADQANASHDLMLRRTWVDWSSASSR